MAIEKSMRVERLKSRAKHCCCRYCGGELHVRQIIFHTQAAARVELYCDQCQKIEYGVEKEIYESAKACVLANNFNHFPDLDDNEQRLQMNIAKLSGLLNWQLKYLGLIGEDGFKIPVQISEFGMDQCTTIDDSELDSLLEEASQWQKQSSVQED